MERLLTVKEVAEYLHVTQISVRRWINAGKIKAVHVGTHIRVSESALAAYLEGGKK